MAVCCGWFISTNHSTMYSLLYALQDVRQCLLTAAARAHGERHTQNQMHYLHCSCTCTNELAADQICAKIWQGHVVYQRFSCTSLHVVDTSHPPPCYTPHSCARLTQASAWLEGDAGPASAPASGPAGAAGNAGRHGLMPCVCCCK